MKGNSTIEMIKANERVFRLVLADIKKIYSLMSDIDKMPLDDIIKKYILNEFGTSISFMVGPCKTSDGEQIKENEIRIWIGSYFGPLSASSQEYIYEIDGDKVKFKRKGDRVVS